MIIKCNELILEFLSMAERNRFEAYFNSFFDEDIAHAKRVRGNYKLHIRIHKTLETTAVLQRIVYWAEGALP